jgi:2-oxoglutarate ferredoxin oxidoreductase subunit beta
MTTTALTKKDFETDQEVRWCPGCGDYAILKAVQSVLPSLGIPKEKFVFVSGIGCSSRFPYYMNTYGFHTIHGRAMPIATGIKTANPELSVWVVTGDGDALSIGGNHFIHLMRRNVDITVLMFNNRIYGLTKGQLSPTSELGKHTKSSPFGSIEQPFNPVGLALAAGATFVARSVDIYAGHLQEVLSRAAKHPGTSFVEIYQNCNIFNDQAFEYMTLKDVRSDQQVELKHGQPLLFGKERMRGIALGDHMTPKVIDVDTDADRSRVLVHNEAIDNVAHAYALSQLGPPHTPTAIGVFRSVESEPYERRLHRQMAEVTRTKGPGQLAKLLAAGDTWTVS